MSPCPTQAERQQGNRTQLTAQGRGAG